VAFGSVKTLGLRHRLVEAVPALQGARSPLRPPGYAVDASPIWFPASSLTTPPWTHDSIRVGGYPFPDRDFHPARDAKLILARQRWASAAARSGSEVRADAGGSRLDALVRLVRLVAFPVRGALSLPRPCAPKEQPHTRCLLPYRCLCQATASLPLGTADHTSEPTQPL
jgi:hypothetical protein